MLEFPKRTMPLFHATTPRKLERYIASGRIITPVRGFNTEAAAREWGRLVGRKVILRAVATDCHKLPDHHNEFGTAWWCDRDVTEWELL